jgi:hypothetical protein
METECSLSCSRNLPLAIILSQISSVCATRTHLSKIHLPTFCLLSGLLHSGFPTNNLHASSSHRSYYMRCPSHSSSLYHSNYNWRRVKVTKIFVVQFSPSSCHFSISPCSEYSRQHPVLKHPQSVFLA